MLTDQSWLCELTPFDLQVFDAFVRKDHPLVVALERIDWSAFEAPLAEYYSADRGQPAYTPLIMFKLEYLRYHYHLSDRQVMERAGTDIGFRYFLQVGKRFWNGRRGWRRPPTPAAIRSGSGCKRLVRYLSLHASAVRRVSLGGAVHGETSPRKVWQNGPQVRL